MCSSFNCSTQIGLYMNPSNHIKTTICVNLLGFVLKVAWMGLSIKLLKVSTLKTKQNDLDFDVNENLSQLEVLKKVKVLRRVIDFLTGFWRSMFISVKKSDSELNYPIINMPTKKFQKTVKHSKAFAGSEQDAKFNAAKTISRRSKI